MKKRKLKFILEIEESSSQLEELKVELDLTNRVLPEKIFESFILFLKRIGIPEQEVLSNLTKWLESIYTPPTKSVMSKSPGLDNINTENNRKKFLEEIENSESLLEQVFLNFNNSLLVED